MSRRKQKFPSHHLQNEKDGPKERTTITDRGATSVDHDDMDSINSFGNDKGELIICDTPLGNGEKCSSSNDDGSFEGEFSAKFSGANSEPPSSASQVILCKILSDTARGSSPLNGPNVKDVVSLPFSPNGLTRIHQDINLSYAVANSVNKSTEENIPKTRIYSNSAHANPLVDGHTSLLKQVLEKGDETQERTQALLNGFLQSPPQKYSIGSQVDEDSSFSPAKKAKLELSSSVSFVNGCEDSEQGTECQSTPLDLSLKALSFGLRVRDLSQEGRNDSFQMPVVEDTNTGAAESESSRMSSPQNLSISCSPLNVSTISERGPAEDEVENLVNEARECEEAFFNTAINETFLTEDSSGLEPPPALPICTTGGSTRRVRVSGEEGPPMVYRVQIYAEQMLVSRILGINEETGDKIELYKCFLCSVAFASVSRLQAHLSQHKQLFQCRKCNFTCESRIVFSGHVQQEHLVDTEDDNCRSLINGLRDEMHLSNSEDSATSAENTVTVAALLSALREKSQTEVGTHCGTGSNISPSLCEDSNDLGPEPLLSTRVSTSEGNFRVHTCRFCGKSFDRAFSCHRHERVHTGFKPCFCRICGRGFSEPRNLRHHVIRFHSDGTLRHMIKRDRTRRQRKNDLSRLTDDVPALLMQGDLSEVDDKSSIFSRVPNDALKETVNKLIFSKSSKLTANDSSFEMSTADLFTLSESAKNGSLSPSHALDKKNSPILGSLAQRNTNLEPGEIQLDLSRANIIDDGEKGRRLVMLDEGSNEDHSPQFSTYAPRLNIVDEPIDRNVALNPITDDIGRTFYECPYCHKFFCSSSDMNRHLDFHEDLRPYNCEYCDYSARTNSQLKVHKMRHEGIKLYNCDICNYNGVTQSDLNRHKKTQSHMARSQNVCSICGLGFYTNPQKEVHSVSAVTV